VIAQLLATLLLAAEDDSPFWLLLIGPAGAGGVYYGLWNYYRNASKSHAFEHETRVEAQPITGSDRKVNEVKGTKRTSIEGDNRNDHRERVQRVP
jgi:hypothetical protein